MSVETRDIGTVPPPRLSPAEKDAIKASAALARHLHPGPLGELAARELLAYAEFGYRGEPGSLIDGLMRALDEELGRRPVEERDRVAGLARAAFRGAQRTSATPGSGTVYRPDRVSSPYGASQGQDGASGSDAFPPCHGCDHRAWAHGDQSGYPRDGARCHADVNGHECGCGGYVGAASEPDEAAR